MNNINFSDKELKKLKDESKKWEIGKLDLVGICTSMETGSISGKDFRKMYRESRFYDPESGIYRISTRNKSIKVFTGKGRNIDEIIESDADYRRMSRLMNHLNKFGQIMISVGGKRAAISANRKNLTYYTKLSEKKTVEFINRMKKLTIIKESSNGNLFVNPVFCMASSGITTDMYMLFKKELDRVLPEAAIEDLQTLAYYELNPDEYKILYDLVEYESWKDFLEHLRPYEEVKEKDALDTYFDDLEKKNKDDPQSIISKNYNIKEESMEIQKFVKECIDKEKWDPEDIEKTYELVDENIDKFDGISNYIVQQIRYKKKIS